MTTYRLFDESMTVTGTPKQIIQTLWDTCMAHEPIETIDEFMEWQKETELRYSGKTIDTSSYSAFIESLVAVGFLIPAE